MSTRQVICYKRLLERVQLWEHNFRESCFLLHSRISSRRCSSISVGSEDKWISKHMVLRVIAWKLGKERWKQFWEIYLQVKTKSLEGWPWCWRSVWCKPQRRHERDFMDSQEIHERSWGHVTIEVLSPMSAFNLIRCRVGVFEAISEMSSSTSKTLWI